MRESATSLRWFFGINGLLYLFSAGIITIVFSSLGFSLPLTTSIIVGMIINSVFALVFLYFAFSLPNYLYPQKVNPVLSFLIIQFVWVVLGTIWAYITTQQLNIVSFAISALLVWYLYRNVARLAKTTVASPVVAEAASVVSENQL